MIKNMIKKKKTLISILTFSLIITCLFSCKEEDSYMSGYWAIYEIEYAEFGNIAYFGDDGSACLDLGKDYERYDKIPNVENFKCTDPVANWEMIKSNILKIEDKEFKIEVVSENECLLSFKNKKNADFKLFRISKYQVMNQLYN